MHLLFVSREFDLVLGTLGGGLVVGLSLALHRFDLPPRLMLFDDLALVAGPESPQEREDEQEAPDYQNRLGGSLWKS